VTYRAELSARALKQMHGLPDLAFDTLIQAVADVVDYPDDPLRTFPTSDPYVRRAEFGGVGLVTYLINDGTQVVTLLDVTWTG
jgi:mRNA-degrading endonuclease RelE of RelBE toxin-antitoxin system